MKKLRVGIEILIFYTLLVILWGAWVRISHSGDGCGDSWPLCEGKFIPTTTEKKTWVEFSHRLTSGLFGIYVFAAFLATRRFFAKASAPRWWAGAALILTGTEALLGAKLVLFGLVGSNDSFFRLFAMGLHFINSALLTGSIVAWYLSLDPLVRPRTQTGFGSISVGFLNWIRGTTAVALLLLGVTGTVAALSTTLFPSTSLTSGLQQDLNEASHFLLRWRIYHPVLGLIVAALGAVFFLAIGKALPREEKMLRWRSQRLSFLFLLTGIVGTVTLFLLSPVIMKVTHLAMAYLLWISIVAWIYGLKTEFVPQKPPELVLFFDGVCHLCHASVRSIIWFDVRRALAFSPLQGELAKEKLDQKFRESMSSLILWRPGKLQQRSTAVLSAAMEGPFEIRLLALLGLIIPRPARDAVYSFVAAHRYDWFGKKEVCELPTASQKMDQAQLHL